MQIATQCITRKNKNWYRPNNKKYTSKNDIKRFNKIGIPPAYSDVCVNKNKLAKLQATAVDKKGKTHYYYHPSFIEKNRKERLKRIKHLNGNQVLKKTAKMIDRQPKGTKEWKAAVALRLITLTGIRSGSNKYFKENGSVGAMTLQPKHVVLKGGGVHLKFLGKSNVKHSLHINDLRLKNAFKYLKKHNNTFTLFGVTREDILQILRQDQKYNFKLKDLRTMLAMNLHAEYLRKLTKKYPQESEKTIKKMALKHTAAQMGHTPSVCKKYYLLA